MAGTFSQIYIQVVFAVKRRECLICQEWKDELHRYISGIINAKGQKTLIVNGMPDHIHAFIGMRPSISIADLVQEMKNNSTNFINERKFVKGYRFNWQNGYGAFSYSRTDVDKIFHYVRNQEEHHAKKSFREEYINLLKEHDVPFEERFLFDWIDPSVENKA